MCACARDRQRQRGLLFLLLLGRRLVQSSAGQECPACQRDSLGSPWSILPVSLPHLIEQRSVTGPCQLGTRLVTEPHCALREKRESLVPLWPPLYCLLFPHIEPIHSILTGDSPPNPTWPRSGPKAGSPGLHQLLTRPLWPCDLGGDTANGHLWVSAVSPQNHSYAARTWEPDTCRHTPAPGTLASSSASAGDRLPGPAGPAPCGRFLDPHPLQPHRAVPCPSAAAATSGVRAVHCAHGEDCFPWSGLV